METARADLADVVPYSEQVDQTRVPAANDFLIERHVPKLFDTPYHHHTSVEVNFLQRCEMTYSFSGMPAQLTGNRITLFWGAAPHRVTNVDGVGLITNIYLSLGQFIRWGLPTELVDVVLSGAVISSKEEDPSDHLLFERLIAEKEKKSSAWRRLHLSEIEARLRRMALEGWSTLLTTRAAPLPAELSAQAMMHVEAMLRFIADNFTIPINVEDIATASNLSVARAGHLFRQVMGISIKQHLTRARLSHARMLLTETDAKVASIVLDSGFASLSAFYEAFAKDNKMSPAQYRANGKRKNPFIAEHIKL